MFNDDCPTSTPRGAVASPPGTRNHDYLPSPPPLPTLSTPQHFTLGTRPVSFAPNALYHITPWSGPPDIELQLLESKVCEKVAHVCEDREMAARKCCVIDMI